MIWIFMLKFDNKLGVEFYRVSNNFLKVLLENVLSLHMVKYLKLKCYDIWSTLKVFSKI